MLQLDQLHEGDCLDLFPQVPDQSVDLVALDPPYNIGRDYPDYDDAMADDDYLRWSAKWLDQAVRVLRPTGSLFVCASEEFVSELKLVAEGRHGLVTLDGKKVIRRKGKPLWPRHHLIWHYTFGICSPKKLGRSHTHILHFVKSRKKHKWNEGAVRVPSARQLVYKDRRADPRGKLPDDTWILRPQEPLAGLKPDHDAWHFSRVAGTFKERRGTDNQMPEQLLGRIIRLCTDRGDTVLDCFAGSGTTLAVAKKLGRHWIGMEKSAGYAVQIRLRLDSCKDGDVLDGKGAV